MARVLLVEERTAALPGEPIERLLGTADAAKRLGVKRFGGEQVIAGNIIIRQRGTQYHAGANVRMGRDHTLYARIPGQVQYAVRGADNKNTVSIVTEKAPA